VSTVVGDPASCSRLGGTLRQLATRLRTSGRAVHEAFDGHDGFGTGDHALARAVPVRDRRRIDRLDAATAAAAREVDRVGSALQAHAADLAEAVADSRRIVLRAEQAGLRVSPTGEVATAWGVSGVADEEADAQQREVLDRTQRELDGVAGLVAQRRHRLAVALRESQDVLATHAEALRR
jgi:hypothetical protein